MRRAAARPLSRQLRPPWRGCIRGWEQCVVATHYCPASLLALRSGRSAAAASAGKRAEGEDGGGSEAAPVQGPPDNAGLIEMQRHKPPAALHRPLDVIVACVPLKSNVNVSAIARTCSCLGVKQLVCCGTAKLLFKVAREATQRLDDDRELQEQKKSKSKSVMVGEDDEVDPAMPWFRVVNTLRHPLLRYKQEGYEVVGLEQTTSSTSLYDFKFAEKTVIVVGSENKGIPSDLLSLCDRVVEVPLHGPPHSLNVASATSIALYEYCRQQHTATSSSNNAKHAGK